MSMPDLNFENASIETKEKIKKWIASKPELTALILTACGLRLYDAITEEQFKEWMYAFVDTWNGIITQEKVKT